MSTLLAELVSGSLSAEIAPHLATADEGAIAAILNREDIPVYSVVSWADFAKWAAATGVRADIEDWKTHTNRSIKAIAWTLSDGLVRGAGAIDFGVADQVTMLNGLVAANLLSVIDKDSLLALSVVHISLAKQQNISATALDIRREIWADNGTRKI